MNVSHCFNVGNCGVPYQLRRMVLLMKIDGDPAVNISMWYRQQYPVEARPSVKFKESTVA